MKIMTWIQTCMGRLEHLQQSLPRLVDCPRSECVVVDYSCPQNAGDWVAQHFPQVRVVRAPGERHFHVSRARNLGAQAAVTPWLGFLDADILVSEKFLHEFTENLAPGGFYFPDEVQIAGNILCARDDFWKAEGFDETYRSWGDEDLDLQEALSFLGLEPRPYPGAWLQHVPHDEKHRTQFFAEPNRQWSWIRNRLYRQLKFDWMRLGGGPLPESMRDFLYRTVERLVHEANVAGKPVQLEMNLGQSTLGFGSRLPEATEAVLSRWQLTRKLSVTLQAVHLPQDLDTPPPEGAEVRPLPG